MTCQCRHCGYVLSYSRDDIGTNARCERCGETIRLPGKLEKFATIQRVRVRSVPAVVTELGGFGMMFFFFPWGMLAGAGMVYAGWRLSNRLVCENCRAQVKSRSEVKCGGCGSQFASE